MSRAFAASRGWGVPSAYRAPTCSLLFSPPPFLFRNTSRRSPSPREPTSGDARTRPRARSREGAPIHVKFGGGAHPRTRLGVGPGGAEGAVSATKSRPWARSYLSAPPPRGPGGFQSFSYCSAFRVRAWTQELPALARMGGAVVRLWRQKLGYLGMQSIPG